MIKFMKSPDSLKSSLLNPVCLYFDRHHLRPRARLASHSLLSSLWRRAHIQKERKVTTIWVTSAENNRLADHPSDRALQEKTRQEKRTSPSALSDAPRRTMCALAVAAFSFSSCTQQTLKAKKHDHVVKGASSLVVRKIGKQRQQRGRNEVGRKEVWDWKGCFFWAWTPSRLSVKLNFETVCVCVCVVLHSSRLLVSPFAEVGIRKSRPPGSPEGPRRYLLVR